MNMWAKAGISLFIGIVLVYWFVHNSGYIPYHHNPIQYMPNMYHTHALRPERAYNFFKDGSGSRVPPKGTVPRDLFVYPIDKSISAESLPRKENPMPKTRAVILRGKKMYNSYCVACHGPKAWGNGLVVPPFPKVPALQSDAVRNMSDNQIFHIITVGRNTMSSYEPQIRPEDRWKIIRYIWVLQLAEHPSKADLDAFKNYNPYKGNNDGNE